MHVEIDQLPGRLPYVFALYTDTNCFYQSLHLTRGWTLSFLVEIRITYAESYNFILLLHRIFHFPKRTHHIYWICLARCFLHSRILKNMLALLRAKVSTSESYLHLHEDIVFLLQLA